MILVVTKKFVMECYIIKLLYKIDTKEKQRGCCYIYEGKQVRIVNKSCNKITIQNVIFNWVALVSQGRLLGKVDAYFGNFRRCNYPRTSPQGVDIVLQCARYSRYF